MKGYVFAFKAFVKRYWDEGVVYLSSVVGVFTGRLQMAETDGVKFKASLLSIIIAVFVSIGVTWFIENKGLAKAKELGALEGSLNGRRKNLPVRLFFAWLLGFVGQLALPQVLDNLVKLLVTFSGSGGGQG